MLFELLSKYKKFISLGFGALVVMAVITANVYAANKADDAKAKSESPAPTTSEKSTEDPSTVQAFKGQAKITVTTTPITQTTMAPTPNQSGQTSQTQVTPTPVASTPTPTPTTQTGTTFKVRYIDGNGNNISLPNMKVKITNPEKGISQESTSAPSFEFNNLPSGSYTVEAQPIDGYSVWHEVCFNCDVENHFYNNSTFSMGVTENHKFIGITLKYIAQ